MENLFFASLVLFASALVAGIVFHRIKLPTILGYILVGIALGSSFADLLGDGPMLSCLPGRSFTMASCSYTGTEMRKFWCLQL
jgi:Kef-type K+ transport system membrane component KefB